MVLFFLLIYFAVIMAALIEMLYIIVIAVYFLYGGNLSYTGVCVRKQCGLLYFNTDRICNLQCLWWFGKFFFDFYIGFIFQ